MLKRFWLYFSYLFEFLHETFRIIWKWYCLSFPSFIVLFCLVFIELWRDIVYYILLLVRALLNSETNHDYWVSRALIYYGVFPDPFQGFRNVCCYLRWVPFSLSVDLSGAFYSIWRLQLCLLFCGANREIKRLLSAYLSSKQLVFLIYRSSISYSD